MPMTSPSGKQEPKYVLSGACKDRKHPSCAYKPCECDCHNKQEPNKDYFLQQIGLPHCLYCHKEHEFTIECLYPKRTNTTPCTEKCGKWFQNKTWEWEKKINKIIDGYTAEEARWQKMGIKEAGNLRQELDSLINEVAEQSRKEGYEEGKRDEELKRNIEGLEHNRIFQRHLEKEKEQARLDEKKRIVNWIKRNGVVIHKGELPKAIHGILIDFDKLQNDFESKIEKDE